MTVFQIPSGKGICTSLGARLTSQFSPVRCLRPTTRPHDFCQLCQGSCIAMTLVGNDPQSANYLSNVAMTAISRICPRPGAVDAAA